MTRIEFYENKLLNNYSAASNINVESANNLKHDKSEFPAFVKKGKVNRKKPSGIFIFTKV
jgi:hypothetical protein